MIKCRTVKVMGVIGLIDNLANSSHAKSIFGKFGQLIGMISVVFTESLYTAKSKMHSIFSAD